MGRREDNVRPGLPEPKAVAQSVPSARQDLFQALLQACDLLYHNNTHYSTLARPDEVDGHNNIIGSADACIEILLILKEIEDERTRRNRE